jgi:Mg2+-importing ATPase
VLVVVLGAVLPFTSLGHAVGLVSIPAELYIVLGGIVVVYLMTMELAKRWFYKSLIKEI